MLTVYTSGETKELHNIKADYEFPENGISPWAQLDWMNAHLDEFINKDVSIKTFSPYILNFLNLMLVRKDVDYSNLNVYEVVFANEEDYSEDKTELCDLKIQNDGAYLIDARLLSDPISHIYERYNKIKEGHTEDVTEEV